METTRGDYINTRKLRPNQYLLWNSRYNVRMTFLPGTKEALFCFDLIESDYIEPMTFQRHYAKDIHHAYSQACTYLRMWSNSHEEQLMEQAAAKKFEEYCAIHGDPYA